MRIALVAPLFESVPPRFYGGTERVVANLDRGLTEAGHEVTVFASADSHTVGHLVPVVDEALRLRHKPTPDPSIFNFQLLAMVRERASEFDVIHNHHDYWGLPLSDMVSNPVLTTLHGRLDIPDFHAAYLGYPRSRLISISDSQRRPLPQLPWLRTIYHGLDLDHLEFSAAPGSYLAFLGRISPEKGPHFAVRIAQKAGIPLKIAAKIEGPESQDFYDREIRPHVDGHNVEFIGEIGEHEKSAFLGGALGTLFPIDWPEPFGLVMVESLACGTPVLGRPLGSVRELLRDGVTGYCDLDIERLAKRVQDLPALDRTRCRDWARDRFSIPRMTEEYLDVYRQLITQPTHYRRDLLPTVERLAQ